LFTLFISVLKKFILSIIKISSFVKIVNDIKTKEKELIININIVIKKKGNKYDSNFIFFFKIFDASNLVISICEQQEKIAHNEKIFVRYNIS
tara:strand:+ start:940 stop:1215 length:276 start_codon:yes stop_codon:yes gene_type:complete